MNFFNVNESLVMKIVAFVLVTMLAFAQIQQANAAGSGVPDVGLILQQAQPKNGTTPFSKVLKAIQIPDVSQPIAASNDTFFLQGIEIIGNTIFDSNTLQPLVMSAVGQRQSLAQIFDLAARITGYYQAHGYPLSRAIIPEQAIQHGELRIEVIEVRFGKILFNNKSRVSDALLRDTAASLQSGQLIKESELDRALLLLSDIPGIVINPTMSRGSVAGTSDLLLNITSSSTVAGDMGVDNHGNSYTGKENIRVNMNVYNPLRFGDVFTLNLLTSGVGMNYGRMAYESIISGSGTRVGGATSSLSYKLGGDFANSNASGSANSTSLWAKQMLQRSRNNSIYAQFQLDQTQLQDHTDAGATPNHNDRHIQSTTANLYGEFRDELLRSSVSTWSLGSTYGRVQFDDAAALINDQSMANTAGSFQKINLNMLRVESLSASSAVHLNVNVQHSKNNLDSSLKMNAGGPYSVRAYAAGTLTGDRGYFLSAEFRKMLGIAWQSQWTAITMLDAATLTSNQKSNGTEDGTTLLKGFGLGLLWVGPNQWTGSSYIARPIGDLPNLPILAGKNKSTRFSLEVKKYY
jgi:hemolysin activation/secretion protein